MLSNNLLNNLSNSYKRLSTYQNQLDTGSKINRPSDDPVVATKGMGYRSTLNKINQFTSNATEASNWLDTTDSALGNVGDALVRVKELVTQASTDSLTSDDRNKISAEIKQIRSQIQDLGNTQVGNKYLFNGTKTTQALFDENGNFTSNTSDKKVNIEVFDGVTIDVNSATGATLFQNIDTALGNLSNTLDNTGSTADQIGAYLTTASNLQDNVLTSRADVGARQNRLDMMTDRLSSQETISTNQMSKNEDIEYEKVISQYMTEQSIHNASLSVGASIIQPSLVDFIK